MISITPENTALILIGYQNDYFSEDGVLRSVIEESSKSTNTLKNTLDLLHKVDASKLACIHTPIIFTEDYRELVNPVGILSAIKANKAFQKGSSGAATINEIQAFEDRIIEIPGKRGLNAFSNTNLNLFLKNRGITNIVLAGAVTSVCIDSTGRSAFEKGYNVIVLSDCTCGRTNLEQDFYCSNIFPVYATVMESKEFILNLP